MEIPTFSNVGEMLNFINNSTKPADHFKIAKSLGFKPKNKAEAKLYAAYIIQGKTKGLTGPSLLMYVVLGVQKILKTPYLVPNSEPIVAPIESVAKATKAPKATEAPKAAKAPKDKRVKHPDFAIVARPDRGGFEGWYGGKAEAFRPTKEKVLAFFQKKYGKTS